LAHLLLCLLGKILAVDLITRHRVTQLESGVPHLHRQP